MRRPSLPDFVSVLLCAALLLRARAGFAQVSPAEIFNPQLRAAEEKYFPQLKALTHAIAAAKFPFPFVLSRYVGLDPEQQLGMDARGIEFVKFHERVVLRVTGNYNAAYNADRLTQNQRADRVFHETVLPILQLVSQEIPADVTCDAVGFEIAYHVRRPTRNADFEGKEILVVVLDRADGFAGFRQLPDTDWQAILNRSEVYLNGEQFGLALGEREPLDLEAHDRPAQPAPSAPSAPLAHENASGSGIRGSRHGTPSARANSEAQAGPAAKLASSAPAQSQALAAAAATAADAKRLQAKYQSRLDALAAEGTAKFHFVEYSPPSFVVFQNRLALQITLRNTLRAAPESSSIYKRAAQGFDLFLAPKLKDILDKIPSDLEAEYLDMTVLNQLTSGSGASSEAVEFVSPLKALRQFADAEITNQDLINQSFVLVNGVRIALNLQLVE